MKKMYDVVPGNPDNCPAPPEHCLDCKHNSLCLQKMERELREWKAAHPEEVIAHEPVKEQELLERCFAIIDEQAAKRRAAEADGVEDC